MRATTIKYEKKINLGNYEGETISIELALGEEDRAADALAAAKQFVLNGQTR